MARWKTSTIHKAHLGSEDLNDEQLVYSFFWLDTGAYKILLEAIRSLKPMDKRQNHEVDCVEIAPSNG